MKPNHRTKPLHLGVSRIFLLSLLAISFVNIQSAKAQVCKGTLTFDKITGVSVKGANQIPLFSSSGNTVTAECNNRCRASADCPGFLVNYENESCFKLDFNTDDYRRDLVPSEARVNFFEKVCLTVQACGKAWIFERVPGFELAGYDDKIEKGISSRMQCQEMCLKDKALPCRSAEYDYTTLTCRLSSQTRRTQPAAYRASIDEVDYMENQCVESPIRDGACEYSEYENQDIGYADLQIPAKTKEECQKRCDETTAFICHSFTYFPSTSVCRLSGDDNLSVGPLALRARNGANYYQKAPCVDRSLINSSALINSSENETESSSPKSSQVSISTPNLADNPNLSSLESSTELNNNTSNLTPSDLNTVKDLNNQTEILKGSVESGNKTANFLNLVTETLNQTSQLARQPKESDPNQGVSLVCSGTSMTLTLNTVDGFEGKIYSAKKPKKCTVRGTGKSETSLTFQYEDPENVCGVETEGEGVFTNTIVVQQHPVIQQKGDRAIKLYCFFEVGDKTVTNGYDVIADTVKPEDGSDRGEEFTSTPAVPTSIVNGTAPTPSVILRIINAEGEDISGTKLGEPLFIRIELDSPSIFDIFARNLIAKSGLDDEEIILMDDRGCPADPVFPGLTKENGTGALIGKFEAFKFSDTTVVNFQVNVQFCQDRCNPIDCGEGVQSYGRRKRRDTPEEKSTKADRLVYDPILNQEILISDTPLRKQIFVDPGTKVSRFRDTSGETVKTGGPGIFVQGNFEEGDVVCTTWTMVIIAGSCIVFLVLSILITCLLCIYNNRRNNRDYKDQRGESSSSNPPMSIVSQQSIGRSTTPVSHMEDHYSGGYGVHSRHLQQPNPRVMTENSVSTLRSLRTSLRD